MSTSMSINPMSSTEIVDPSMKLQQKRWQGLQEAGKSFFFFNFFSDGRFKFCLRNFSTFQIFSTTNTHT